MHELVAIAIAFIGGWLIPWAAMRVIMHYRFKSGKQQSTNYAGRTVSYGLALVWPVWAICLGALLIASGYIIEIIISLHGAVIDGPFTIALIQSLQSYSVHNTFLVLAVPLVLLCFLFGWIDDRFGAHGDGGFKGHIKSLLRGKLTTGMVKVIGIGLTALAVSIAALRINLSAADAHGAQGVAAFDIAWIVIATCAIAFSANLINLFDLRPVRASKVYSIAFVDIFVIVTLIVVAVAFFTGMHNFWQDILQQLIYLIWALGPIFAIWRFDARGRAMLGDAGANPMGALLGLYATMGLWLLLPVYVIVVFFLNMLSEKVSFSTMIARTPLLLKIDSLGRKHEGS